MGVLDEIEQQDRKRTRTYLVVVLLVLAAAGGGFLASRQAPVPENPDDAAMPAEAVELGGGRSGLRPAVLEEFDKTAAVSADGAEIGREIDSAYSYPQRRGIRGLRITFTSPFIDNQLRVWLKKNGADDAHAEGAFTEIHYVWSPERGPELIILGWPRELQPLELKRQENTLLKLAELVVPRTQEEFLKDYGVRVGRNDKGMVVWGERANPDGALKEFYKYFSPNRMVSFIEGEGAHASFETLTYYQKLDDQRVVDVMKTWVETPNKTLRYDIEPVYGNFEGTWIAAQITQTYYDETGAVEGMPLSLVLKEIEIDRVSSNAE
ncbi:MAG: hypothetical protein KDH09_01895 [Chrysiogenetes bacterium]|nr:hypothetical protein [Chrysiogenetes bacterium]